MDDALLGTKIGHVRFVDKIATGGMGEVYAGYDETLQRRVALKGIKQDFRLSEEAKGRFLREARVLSQLGHPNICQIYDYIEGDRSDYIVMELVSGRSLGRAIRKGIDPKAKMPIAEQVAGVLVAAHEKGVVHRDLKPDNVMLTEEGQVKVLDFGLSRQIGSDATWALSEESTAAPPAAAPNPPHGEDSRGLPSGSGPDLTLDQSPGLTTVGAVVGTIGYMSPEQARGEVATAASDMYSFGLLLQELFTGKPPMEPGLDVGTRLEKAKRGETLPVIGVDPDLAGLIQRLKSLAPGARPSAGDTVQRLVWIREKPHRRRRKTALWAAVAALVLFSAAMAVQSIRATRAERRAKEQAETARQVSDFLTSIFKLSDPSEARGRTVTAREILDTGAKKIAAELSGRPVVQARLMDTIGTVYMGLGLYKEAQPLLLASLDLREKNLPPTSPEVAEGLSSLAILYWRQGRYAEAEPLAKRALDLRERALGENDPRVAKSLNVLAVLDLNQGRYAEAEPLMKRAIAVLEKAKGENDPEVASYLNNLALLYFWQGRMAEAEPLYRRVLSISERTLGPDHPNVATCLISLAAIAGQQGRYEEAEPLLRRALAIQEKVLGPDHPGLAPCLADLAEIAADQGRYSEAETYFERTLAIQEKALGPDHPEVAASLCMVANLYMNQARLSDAEPLLTRALAICKKALGPDHPDEARTLGYVVALYLDEGRYTEAEPVGERELAVAQKALGPDHPEVARALVNMADLRCAQGRYSEAAPLYEKALSIRTQSAGPRSLEAAVVMLAFASCEFHEEKLDAARKHLTDCLGIARDAVAKMPKNQEEISILGSALLLKGRIEAASGEGSAAQASWREGLSVLEPSSKGGMSLSCQVSFAELLLCLGRTDEARPVVARLLAAGYRDPDFAALCRSKGLPGG